MFEYILDLYWSYYVNELLCVCYRPICYVFIAINRKYC